MATETTDQPTTTEPAPFQPRLVAILCNWCSYAGADLAGSSRIHYPASLRIVRVPCSGRIDPLYVLRAFERGADAVLVAGCHPGDCHYAEGNYYARRRLTMLQELLRFAGVPEERFYFRWVSAAEGPEFAHLISEITEKVTPLGPYKPEAHEKFELPEDLLAELNALDETTPECAHGAEAEATEAEPET
ncbi:MAG TPA: hydrogenase iron-sulfur subunit [Armatimonadota bacterium]|jgi:coenzyme F420-reducing hydrogenase delta subunit